MKSIRKALSIYKNLRKTRSHNLDSIAETLSAADHLADQIKKWDKSTHQRWREWKQTEQAANILRWVNNHHVRHAFMAGATWAKEKNK